MLTIKVEVGEIYISFGQKSAEILSNYIYENDIRNTLTFVFRIVRFEWLGESNKMICSYIRKTIIFCEIFIWYLKETSFDSPKMFMKSEVKSYVSKNCLSG